jgi:tetratricopeptide (TPR) repeat protein
MQELRLVFSQTALGSFTVTLESAPGQAVGVAVPFTPFLDDDDYEDLRWYLEEYMDLPDGGAVVRARSVERKIETWGRQLHDAVFGAKENADLLAALLRAPEPRELTIATDKADLLRLPWELIADGAGSLAQRVAVRRQLETPETLVPREVQLPLRMLYIVSRPDDAGFIDPRVTTRALVTALDPLGGSVRLDFCRPPTLARMEGLLREAQTAGDPYDVVHFDGHGTFLPEAQIGALCFEKPDDGSGKSETDFVRADRLGDLLAQYKIPLVVLEACRSATIGKAAVFRSVAPRLIRAGVGSVLSMGHAVLVEAARVLLDRFYRELAGGATIGHAVAQGRAALRSTPTRWIEYGPKGKTVALADWFLPHLYQRGLDEPLLPRAAAVTQDTVRQFDLFLSHNHNNKARVEALARELANRHGLRVWLDQWEMLPGTIEQQCDAGIQQSRFTIVAVSEAALASKWVTWEIATATRYGRRQSHIIPLRLESVEVQTELQDLLWIDLFDPAEDANGLIRMASLIRSLDAADAQELRGFRPPPEHGQTGAFPRPPQFGFHGRARELYALERRFRRDRGIVLHAMGGMGKTTLAAEAAQWWTRSGLFRDGACFVSFERTIMDAARIVSVLGEYCEGPKFHQRPEVEQRKRAIEFFRDRAVLMVWDNFESVLPAFQSEQIAHDTSYTDAVRQGIRDLFSDLTSGPGRGCVLVTCRPGETGLPGARKFELQGLARADSLFLLHRILERDGASLDDPRLTKERLSPLLEDLADHPLSLELVGPHLRTLTPEQIRTDFGKLVDTLRQESDQDRNTSLRASLEFSRRHLSDAARAALPWLGLFNGGVFEDILLDVSEIEPTAWNATRTELVGIALLRTESDILIGERPFLRFHPTLAIASADATLTAQPEIRQRFLRAYFAVMRMLDKALRGDQSRAAMEILNLEEMNWRTAVRWALADGEHSVAGALGETFSRHLKMSGRLREHHVWTQMLRDEMTRVGFTNEAAEYEREHALTLFTQGDPQGAIGKLQALIERLRQTREFDPAFHVALAVGDLGKVLHSTGASVDAVPVLREGVSLCEQLVERAGGQPWEQLLKTAAHAKAAIELGNLSATMGDLANALRSTGQHHEALAVAEKCVLLQKALDNQREVAADHARCAYILMDTGRYDEADARYELALTAARRAGDKALEGIVLQHQGSLAYQLNQLDRASRFYQQALHGFQAAGNASGVMGTYNLLGLSEQKAGRLGEARAWYERSRELAVERQHPPGIGQAAQNIGIVCQEEGKAARAKGDEAAARRHFNEARRSVEESLRIDQERGHKPGQAGSLGQLAIIHLLLGDLTAAERYAHAAREILDSLGLKEAHINYATLAQIAAARGDTALAAEWERKRDELVDDLKLRAGRGGSIPGQMLRALEQLAIACARAGFGGEPIEPGAEENLATLDGFPAPLPAFSMALRELAAGRIPSVPSSLPRELQKILEDIAQAIHDSPHG